MAQVYTEPPVTVALSFWGYLVVSPYSLSASELLAGGQGHADVAVTCLLPLDEGHLKPPAEDAQRAGRPASRGSSPFQRVFNSVAASAAEAAKGFVSNLTARDQGPDEYLRLRCALMRLSLPVELLAAQLLRLPLQDIVADM